MTDRRTDRQTHDDSYYRASIARTVKRNALNNKHNITEASIAQVSERRRTTVDELTADDVRASVLCY